MKIQLLVKNHNRKNFTCEEDSLTEYIRKQVSQDIRKRLATCFVAVDNKQNVIDYEFQVILIRFIGTHKQYDKIDAKTI